MHFVCPVQAAGTKGRRYAMKNTRIMMTQPMGGSQVRGMPHMTDQQAPYKYHRTLLHSVHAN
jgi:ATP-dependent protease ClpP protease subunit